MSSDINDPQPESEKPAIIVSNAGPPAGGENTVAERYIREEVVRAKKSLRATQIGGTIVAVLLGGYLLYLTTHFTSALRPHAAAEIAEGIINQQIDDKGPELAAQLKVKIPEYIAQTPDYALEQLPKYRTSLEDRVESDLNKYCQSTSDQLGKHLDAYLDQHKDEIKGILTVPNDPAALKAVGDSLKQDLMAYIHEKPASGESLGEQIDKSLSALQEVSKKMRHLAANKNLKPEEVKTRRAIAILSSAIDKQKDLPRMPAVTTQ